MVNCKNGFGGCNERKAQKHSAHRVVVAAVGLSGVRVFERAMDIPAFLDNTAP